MNAITAPTTEYQCQHCQRSFRREGSLLVHMCEPKRRHQERDEVGVNIGLKAYQRFYEITQGSCRSRNWEDFAASSYYRAFVKFGRHCQKIRAINVPRFTDWLIRENKKLDHWCRDSIYSEWLYQYLRTEHVNDALSRAVEHGMCWQDDTENPAHDYLRFGNDNAIAFAITTGRISAWVLYNCESGQGYLNRINPEQLTMIWPWIDADYWDRRFREYPADREYAREILSKAGW
jgi:hypothetical protein